MYDPNGYLESEDQRSGNYGNSKSWLSTEPNNVDRVLYNDLVQIVPLVQSLIDRKASSSFTRRGSMIYTKTPSRDSRKNDAKNKNAVKSTLGKKHLDKEQLKDSIDGSGDDCSVSSANMAAEKDKALNALREQLEDLHQKILEKDELLKDAETYKNQMISLQSQVDELKCYAAERDSIVKSSQQQLSDAKIKLADKQAALEKLQWETKTSNQRVEGLQDELDSMQAQISSLMILFEGLSKDEPITPTEDYDIRPYCEPHLLDIDDIDEIEMQKMEEARMAYVAAVALAKEREDEESLVAASKARLYLQSFVIRNNAG